VDLVFEQRVFAQVAEHAAALPGSPIFGALVGHLFEDPTCERRWARIERAIRSPASIPETADASRLGQTLRATEMDWVPEEGEVLLGWYRTHLQGGLYLSPEEARFHEGGFPDPWGLALVLAGTGERRAGGVFQRTDPEGLSRSVYTPFYELVDPSSEFNGTTRRTFVGWANYQTETPVLRAGRGSVSAELPLRTKGTRASAKPPAGRASTAKPAEPPVPAAPRPAKGAASAPPAAPQPARGAASPPPATTQPVGDAAPPVRGRTPALPPPGDHPREPVGPIHAPGTPDPVSVRAAKPPRETRERPKEHEPFDSEAEWEKRQIQRTLMAVGRSLGPSDLGALGAPGAGIERAGNDDGGARGASRDESTWRSRAPEAPSGPVAATPVGAAPEPGATVIPIHRDFDGPTGLVGRARRRRRVPGGKVLAAAAGLTLVATAGLVGTRTMKHDGAAAESPGGATVDESSMAGLTLSPEELRGDRDPRLARREAGSTSTGDGERVAATDSPPLAEGRGEDDAASSGVDAPAETTTIDDRATAPGQATGPNAAPDGTPTGNARASGPARGEIVRAPSLEELHVDDPAVAVYENALAIFREEADRYETARREFDDGNGTCNPLNLSYRGVRDAFQRLERRMAEAGERLPASTLRSFQSSERRFAMTRTHYTLTDCPMPVGG